MCDMMHQNIDDMTIMYDMTYSYVCHDVFMS